MASGKSLGGISKDIKFRLSRGKEDNIEIGYLLREAKAFIDDENNRQNFKFKDWCNQQFGWKASSGGQRNRFISLADFADELDTPKEKGLHRLCRLKCETFQLEFLSTRNVDATERRIRNKLISKLENEYMTRKEIEKEFYSQLTGAKKAAVVASVSSSPSVATPKIRDLRKKLYPDKIESTDWSHTSIDVWDLNKEHFKDRDELYEQVIEELGHDGSRAELRPESDVYTGEYSVFAPSLAHWLIIRYAGKDTGANIIDPFAGGEVRAVVATVLGHNYHGWEVRQKQIDDNEKTLAKYGLKGAKYYKGDGTKLEGGPPRMKFDMLLTCPPYYDKELYSDQEDDISNERYYFQFDEKYARFPHTLWDKMKPGAFACIVVDNPRPRSDKEADLFKRFLRNLVGDTHSAFVEAGFQFWDEITMIRTAGDLHGKAGSFWEGKKLVGCTQQVLIFRRPEEKVSSDRFMRDWQGVDLWMDRNLVHFTVSPYKYFTSTKADFLKIFTGFDVKHRFFPVKVLAKDANLEFIKCGKDCIDYGCTAECCDGPKGKPCKVSILVAEIEKIETYGVKVKGAYLQPRKGEKLCPFKTEDHLCELHDTDHKPFGCIAAPFTLKGEDTLVVMERYQKLPCRTYAKKHGGQPAYKVFRASLDEIFGGDEAEVMCEWFDEGKGDYEAHMYEPQFMAMLGRELFHKGKLRGIK